MNDYGKRLIYTMLPATCASNTQKKNAWNLNKFQEINGQYFDDVKWETFIPDKINLPNISSNFEKMKNSQQQIITDIMKNKDCEKIIMKEYKKWEQNQLIIRINLFTF